MINFTAILSLCLTNNIGLISASCAPWNYPTMTGPSYLTWSKFQASTVLITILSMPVFHFFSYSIGYHMFHIFQALHSLGKASNDRGMRLHFLPRNFKKAMENTSKVLHTPPIRTVYWRIEWLFPQAGVRLISDRSVKNYCSVIFWNDRQMW